MIHQKQFSAMGCQMLAALDCWAFGGVGQVLESVPEWFEEWEAVLSRFRPESELCLLNLSPEVSLPVSETLWGVFKAAIRAEQASHGLVTPAVFEALVYAGYSESFDSLPKRQPGQPGGKSLQPLSLAGVAWSEAQHTIRLPAGLRLDFGGTAKGWAAQQAMKRLEVYGPALVDAGGDIAISGFQQDGQPWPVDMADPFHPGKSLGLLMLGRCGVATSGRDYRRWQQDTTWRHHIIDPRSGLPADTDVMSATVIAPNILEAETAAKTALILGGGAGLDWLEARESLAGALLLEDGRFICNSRFRKYLWD